MKKIVLISVVILIIIVAAFWIYDKELKKEFACEIDSDCDFYYTEWDEDNPCSPCWYVNDEVVCMNKEKKLEKEHKIIEEEFGGVSNIPLCTPCIDNDWDSYSCGCIDNKCLKVFG